MREVTLEQWENMTERERDHVSIIRCNDGFRIAVKHPPRWLDEALPNGTILPNEVPRYTPMTIEDRVTKLEEKLTEWEKNQHSLSQLVARIEKLLDQFEQKLEQDDQ